MFVLRADDPENPTGSYSLAGKLATAGNLWAIDGTVLRYGGKLYLVWSGKPQAGSRTQNLYIQPMQNPYTNSCLQSARLVMVAFQTGMLS